MYHLGKKMNDHRSGGHGKKESGAGYPVATVLVLSSVGQWGGKIEQIQKQEMNRQPEARTQNKYAKS